MRFRHVSRGLFPLFAASAALAAPVEVTHPVAPFLRRLEEKQLTAPGFWSTLPRDDGEVASILRRARERRSELTSWDRERLDRFLAEFDPEEARRETPLHLEDSLFSLRGGVEYFTGGYYRDSLPETGTYAFGSLTPSLRTAYGRNLDLVSSATVGMERSKTPRFVENYDPQRGLPYNTNRDGKDGFPQSVSTFDGFRTVLGFGSPRVRLEFGQDWNQWGPGNWQHATVGAHPYFWVSDSLPPNATTGYRGSDSLRPGGYRRGYRYPGEGPPLPQARLRAGFGPWEYTKIASVRTGLWKDSGAYLIAHRLQVNLGSWRVGVAELMSSGSRFSEWAALIPGAPLKFAEHAGGDRSNLAVSGDLEWLWGRGSLYAELYVDDYSGPPLDYWGNKLAFTLGGSWQDPFGLPLEWRGEFARTDPWVYQHAIRNSQMQSAGALLGSSLPPNARALFSSLAFPLPRGAQGQIDWRWRQRDAQSPGSSIFDVHEAADGNSKGFLAGDVETRNEVLFSAQWNWRRFVELRGGAGAMRVSGWRGDPSRKLDTPEAFGEVWFRY